ncbi:hypothetical protein SNE40_023034 [Patella caerulea]
MLSASKEFERLLSLELREEIVFWGFLSDWQGSKQWVKEEHLVLCLSTDASNFKWGAEFILNSKKQYFGDYWRSSEIDYPIMIKEALALLRALICIRHDVKDYRLDVNIDNKPLLDSWKKQGSRSSILNNTLKDIYFILQEFNIHMNLVFIPSSDNPADGPSRAFLKSDACLSDLAFKRVDIIFGPHTIDLMSLDCNAMKGRDGVTLPHYTPYSTPNTSGINVFAQSISSHENTYAFPPFNMISAVINLIKQKQINFTLIVPAISPIPVWFPQISLANQIVVLAYKGDKNIMLYPSKGGFRKDKFGLPWNLWIVRFCFQTRKENLFNFGPVFFRTPVLRHHSMLLIGDSIVRSIVNMSGIKVFSIPGASILDISRNLINLAQSVSCIFLYIHVGINVNRTHFEFEQLAQCFRDFDILRNVLNDLFKSSTIFLSSVLKTSEVDINARVSLVNKNLARMASANSWYLIRHNNIGSVDLADGTHLNEVGARKLLQNFLELEKL